MDPINIPNVCFSVALNLDDEDYKEKIEWKKQREERGFDDSELWDLDATILRFTLPRLKEFVKQRVMGYPSRLEFDYPDCKNYDKLWWEDILPNMIKGIERYIEEDPDFEDRTVGTDKDLELFFKYFSCLWT